MQPTKSAVRRAKTFQEYDESQTKRFKPSWKQRQAIHSIKDNTCTLMYGPAGTGKTLIASFTAWQLLKSKESGVDKIIISRLATDERENIGALPGELEDKLGYMKFPILDNLAQYVKMGDIQFAMDKKEIEILPLTHARGRSLQNAVLIIEECQNLRTSDLLTLLTRVGENSRVVLTGDPMQMDVRGENGVLAAIRLIDGIESTEIVEFDTEDIQRSPFVKAIVERSQKLQIGML